MNIIGSIFWGSISITLMFAGIAKILSYKKTIHTIINMRIFPMGISKVMGHCMPIFEIILSILLIFKPNKLIILLLLAYLIFFIGLNFKFTVEKRNIKCCCYGNFIESKLSKAGLIHYTYLLCLLIYGYICITNNIIETLNRCSYLQLLIVIGISFIFTINGFLIRSVMEKYGLKER